MTTANDLVEGALRKLGVLAAGETASAEDAQTMLDALNSMIDSWKIESLMLYTYTQNTFNLVANQRVYTIGTGGDFNVDRPVVQPMSVKLRLNDSQAQDLPMAILDYQQYAAIILKQTTSTVPGAFHMDGGNPLRNIFIWPVPQNSTTQLLLWLGNVLGEFTALSDTVVLPPGYRRALIYNLAVEGAPEFGRQLSPATVQIAVESKAIVERANFVSRKMVMPPELVSKSGRYNIFNDGVV